MDMKQIMEMAQGLQSQMVKAQETLSKAEYSGEAGAGMVRAKVNGQFEIVEVKIEPSLWSQDDPTLAEDLIRAALNNALRQVVEAQGKSLGGVGQGMGLDLNALMNQFRPGGDGG